MKISKYGQATMSKFFVSSLALYALACDTLAGNPEEDDKPIKLYSDVELPDATGIDLDGGNAGFRLAASGPCELLAPRTKGAHCRNRQE